MDNYIASSNFQFYALCMVIQSSFEITLIRRFLYCVFTVVVYFLPSIAFKQVKAFDWDQVFISSNSVAPALTMQYALIDCNDNYGHS